MYLIIDQTSHRILSWSENYPSSQGEGRTRNERTAQTFENSCIVNVTGEISTGELGDDWQLKKYIVGVGLTPRLGVEKTFREFQDHCYLALGLMLAPSGTLTEIRIAGATRYGEIVNAVRSDTANGLSVAAWERYENGKLSNAFYKETTEEFLALASAHLNEGEADAILGRWELE